MTKPLHTDEGQTSVFTIGVTVVILLVALTISAIMSVTLQHRKLLSLADSAAQSAATAFTLADPGDGTLTITDASARHEVQEHMRILGAAEYLNDLNIEAVYVEGDTTVLVRLSATAHPPVVNFVVPAGIQVSAEGTARTRLEQ
ncbi:MAG TPA: Tad domain-containing protein [Candidatus Yaniella excrementigallinarum]|nr:Tad domain-containing protein [Candidatus Yaniella excrementigallinarum]